MEPIPDLEMVAIVNNQHCLAKNCGCFSCIDRCESEAIKIIPGVGIRINPMLCNGCGICEYVCPITPKAIRLTARDTEPLRSAKYVAQQQKKGETTC